jgi:ribosomal protein S25
VNTFYLLAKGAVNVSIADLVSRQLEEKNLVKITDKYVHNLKGEKSSVLVACIRLENQSTLL